jgi:predicted nucleotidyltransferase
MESLNGYSPKQIKSKIAKTLDCSEDNIKLFGSRITGGWRKDSDLDCFVVDIGKADLVEVGLEDYIGHVEIEGLRVEYRWLHSFEEVYSHLRHGSI